HRFEEGEPVQALRQRLYVLTEDRIELILPGRNGGIDEIAHDASAAEGDGRLGRAAGRTVHFLAQDPGHLDFKTARSNRLLVDLPGIPAGVDRLLCTPGWRHQLGEKCIDPVPDMR